MKFIRAVAMILILLCTSMDVHSQSQNQDVPWRLRYTMAEYNAFQRAASEKSPERQIELLDVFVSQYPNSDLLVYAYPVYYSVYTQLRNFPKVFEYADKLIALGDKAPVAAHYAALCWWAAAYNSSNSQDAALAAKATDRAFTGLKLIPSLKPPPRMDAKEFEAEKKRGAMHLYLTAAAAEFALKDYGAANESIRALQVLDSYDPRPLIEPRPYTTDSDSIGRTSKDSNSPSTKSHYQDSAMLKRRQILKLQARNGWR